MRVFLNAPVHNRDFTFTENSGKATGIRLAAVLNSLTDAPCVPHLWNTATLYADKRYASSGSVQHRTQYDQGLIAHKYRTQLPHDFSIVADTDEHVEATALSLLERCLEKRKLSITTLDVPVCAFCKHMVGYTSSHCAMCTHDDLRQQSCRVLVNNSLCRDTILPSSSIFQARRARHLQGVAAHVPTPLLLSRTRHSGVSLDAIGLPGLVLDPRTTLHITALVAAVRMGADHTEMTITPNALQHIAAYGQAVAEATSDGLLFSTSNAAVTMRYALHGYVPYGHITQQMYEALHYTEAERIVFEQRFLPLASWNTAVRAISPNDLPGLATHCRRALRATFSSADLCYVASFIKAGHTQWVMNKKALAAALSYSANVTIVA